MTFVKFAADNEKHDEVEKAASKTRKRKRRADSHSDCKQSKNAERPRPNKRRTKVLDFNECKQDLKHFFYISTKAQTGVRHSVVPDFNAGLNDLDDLLDLPKNMYPHCDMAEVRPIYYAKKLDETLDTCFARTMARDTYRWRLSFIRTHYQTKWKNNRQIRKLAQDSCYHGSLFTLAERLEKNPDPYFYGNYDFYYTGGNLCTLPKYETHNVLHVDDNEIGSLKLSTYCHRNQVAKLQECTSKKLPMDGDIFEITTLKALSAAARDLVAVRQLNNITILKIEPLGNSMKMIVDFRTKNAPLISLAQSTEKPDMLVVTTMKQNIRVYDISQPKKVHLNNLYKMQRDGGGSFPIVSCWNRIKHWHGETFLYANEHQLMFADFRASQDDWLKTECTFSTKEYPCEVNTSLALSEFDQLFYVGTTHKLRCMDARYLKQQQTNYEDATVCEWTHQLDYPPAFLDVHRDDTHEYVACASQLAGELRICELTQSKHLKPNAGCAFESLSLPWQPPTLQEAYESAYLAGKLLQPEINLKQRISALTTGMGFFRIKNHNETQALLMHSNSVGDVYAQTMKRRQEDDAAQTRITAKSDEVIGEFVKNLCELKKPALNYTDIADLKVMRNVFFATQLNRKNIKQETDDLNAPQQENAKDWNFKRNKGRWRKSMATLHSYKDALVPDLLSIWDIPCEDETDIKYSALQSKFKHEKSNKDILNWLNKADEIAPTTTVPLSNLNNLTMSFEASGILEPQAQSTQILTADSYEITFLESSGQLDASVFNNTSRTIIAKPKAAKAKKKHVKGF